MKFHTLMPLALLSLALTTMPALAQSTTNSQSSSHLPDVVGNLLRLNTPRTLSKTAVKPAVGGSAKTYQFGSADYPGSDLSLVLDQNATETIGYTQLEDYVSGFTLKAGTYELYTVPGFANETTGINTTGQIVGIYADSSDTTHGFLDSGGVITNIDDPSAEVSGTAPFDINDGGEIVGYFVDSSSVHHGFYTLDGGVSFTNFDYPGAISTLASGVNKAGSIVGEWEDSSGNVHSFLLSKGIYRSFDFPSGSQTTAVGINDSNEIAGFFADASNVFHGFIYSNGAFTQVDVAGAASTQITRIKNNGRITGLYIDPLNENHGFTGH
jgi:probable HAF family extracellular repeat protein